MALTKRTESNIVYLQVKHYSLWRELKKPVEGCETIIVNNPRTGEPTQKHGYRFDTVSGSAVQLVKYDTERRYWPARYFGFKLHLLDGAEKYVLDMPYASQVLRRFLRVAPNINWDVPLSITVFKGKKDKGDIEPTGIWFQQGGGTVKPYFSREQPHDMPQATQDPDTHEWDFKTQHRWLIDKLQSETIPDIEAAAKRFAPPIEPARGEEFEEGHETEETIPLSAQAPTFADGISDDDVPF